MNFSIVLYESPYSMNTLFHFFKIANAIVDDGDSLSVLLYADSIYFSLTSLDVASDEFNYSEQIEFLIKKGVKFYLCETALKKRGIYELYDKNMKLSSLSEFSKIISESDRVINL